jgi:hypothetical protein
MTAELLATPDQRNQRIGMILPRGRERDHRGIAMLLMEAHPLHGAVGFVAIVSRGSMINSAQFTVDLRIKQLHRGEAVVCSICPRQTARICSGIDRVPAAWRTRLPQAGNPPQECRIGKRAMASNICSLQAARLTACAESTVNG